MRILSILLLCALILIGCGTKNKDKESNFELEMQVKAKSVLDHVKLAINPKFKDWVLFENGTYIILDDISQIDNIENEAIRLMKEFGPVQAGGPAGDFNVISLLKTEGWIVSGHGYGMYTYVHPSELNTGSPDDLTIGLYGRSKRNRDAENPKIVHINNAER